MTVRRASGTPPSTNIVTRLKEARRRLISLYSRGRRALLGPVDCTSHFFELDLCLRCGVPYPAVLQAVEFWSAGREGR